MWRCKNCHSTSVQSLGWVDLNNSQFSGNYTADDADEFWCDSCESHVDVYFKNEPNEEFIQEDLDPDDFDPD